MNMIVSYPEVAVGVLIVNEEGNIFLMKSPKWQNMYCLPGGHIELGETINDAVIREVKEETDLDVVDVEFLEVQEAIFPKEFHKKRHFIFLEYICKVKNTNVTLDGREGTEYVWVSVEDALQLPLNPYTKNTVTVYQSR